jgi:hypothetical protein
MRSSSSVCPPGENAGVGRPGGEEEGAGEESRRRIDGLDLDLPFAGPRDLDLEDGAEDGSAMEAGDCMSAIISSRVHWLDGLKPSSGPLLLGLARARHAADPIKILP